MRILCAILNSIQSCYYYNEINERGDVMKGDYGSMIWVNDREGKEYVCTADFEHRNEKEFERLNEQERRTCSDVNVIVGSERW